MVDLGEGFAWKHGTRSPRSQVAPPPHWPDSYSYRSQSTSTTSRGLRSCGAGRARCCSYLAWVLFIAALTVIPGQAYWMLGTELIVVAVICMVGMVMLLQGRTVNPMASLSSMLLIVAGIVLIIGLRAGLYLLVVPVLANLGFGFYLAWMLLLAFRSE
jgi:hypothetical protein